MSIHSFLFQLRFDFVTKFLIFVQLTLTFQSDSNLICILILYS